jgi:hypothetical protein
VFEGYGEKVGFLVIACSGSHKKRKFNVAGWSSPVAREAHNLEVAGSNPVPAT